jgi:hypothetical protein
MYTRCPKCGHAPLPKEQASPAACPACGIILAKFGAVAAPRAAAAMREPHAVARDGDDEEVEDRSAAIEGSLIGRFTGSLLHVPNQVSNIYWWARVGTLVVIALWTVWIFKDIDIPDGKSGSNFLHMVLLPFHEAGHYLIFRWFGEFIMILGGTLGQHLMPIVVAGSLLIQRRDPFGAAVFAWLLGYSVVDMAVYMYDAFDPHLTLIGGLTGAESDGHDWQNLFGDTGLLKKSRGIGQAWGVIGRLMMVGFLVYAGVILWLQHKRISDSPFAEEENP